jgi:hypothetical protein
MLTPVRVGTAVVSAAYLVTPWPGSAQTPPSQPPGYIQSPSAPGGEDQSQPSCRRFTAPVAVGGGRQQQAVGTTCLEPDGSLQVTLETPGLPRQVYTMPPPPPQQAPPPAAAPAPYAYPYPYAYPAPYYWSDPWVFGGFPFFAGGSFFFVHNHFFFDHRFDRFHRGFHDHGFHAGFHGGFHGGGHR